MSKVAAFIVGDSNLFYDEGSRAVDSVYHNVMRVCQATPIFGMTIMYLADCPDKVEEMLQYSKCLGVDQTVVVVCAGQHDVLEGRKRDSLRAISKLATFTEKYKAIIATIRLFDESSYERKNERLGYRDGVRALNLAWFHEAVSDPSI